MKTLVIILLLFTGALQAKVEIDQSCLKDSALKGISGEDLLANASHNLDVAEKAIFWCEFKYPGLRQYTREWRRAKKNVKFMCKDPDGQSAAFYTGSYFNYKENVVTLVSNNAKEALSAKSASSLEYSTSVLIHEIFHATSANFDTSEHNRLERIMPSESCEVKDASYDRVSLLESLCSGTNLNSSASHAGIELYKKIQKCGIKKGCMDSMMEQIEFFSDSKFTYRSDGMDEKTAREVCEDFKETSMCTMIEKGLLKLDQTQELEYVKKSIPLQTALNELRSVKKFLPSSDKLPLKFIEHTSGIRDGFLALRKSPCFTQSFNITDDTISCKDANQKIQFCSPPHFKRDERCDFKTRISIQMWLNKVYGSAKSENLTHFYDKLHALIDQKEVPPASDLDKVFAEVKVQNVIGRDMASRIFTDIQSHYPKTSAKHCTVIDRADIKLFSEILSRKPMVPPVPACAE